MLNLPSSIRQSHTLLTDTVPGCTFKLLALLCAFLTLVEPFKLRQYEEGREDRIW